jgi:(1->4)-alpha-D-glucan 1-alpha-D-glucosylmutase
MNLDTRIPRATYRLQLHREFGFRRAAQALPYLAALGISHVYCSPLLRAAPGSAHGYDVVDPAMINPDLGDAADFDHFHRQMRAHGLALLLDIVPNHMGVESAENAWWQDVLANGAASPYAARFDIDWSGSAGVPAGRLLLPVLGQALGKVIADGELRLQAHGTAFRLHYFDRSLPVNARGAALVLRSAAERAAPGDVGTASFDEMLADPALVAAVADCQHYLLCPWQDAGRRINYRRFFDVAGLAAVRVEDPAVFEAGHRLVIELVKAGIVDALRIDHPDGLRDPRVYFERLQASVAARRGAKSASPIYLLAEKILAEGEELPPDWPVNGPTGYDFANLACGVLLDSEGTGEIDRIWRAFTGETAPSFREMAIAAKHEVMAASFGGELEALARGFAAIARPPAEDMEGLAATIAEVIACFPAYRTYPGPAATGQAARYVREACEEARRRLDLRAAGDVSRRRVWLRQMEACLVGPTGDIDGGHGAQAVARAAWAVRFQQLCAPVMAKGVEDTALYRWTRLLSVNDVGADPDVTGVSVDRFHAANRRRLEGWPHAMLASSTHDSKRGEYARLRINVLTEDPSRWEEVALAWRDEAERLVVHAEMQRRPSAHDLYLLFQTFVGTWPVTLATTPPGADAAGRPVDAAPPAPDADYEARIKAYMTKACREAKRDTSWARPDQAYEASIHRLVTLMIGDPACAARIGRDVRPYAWYGALGSLTQTVLKLTVPGVPDIYQGASILDDSLVDPDNRRPVDFAQRKAIADEFAVLADGPAGILRRTVVGWLATGDFDRAKLWIIHRLLGWRARHPQVFQAGDYRPLPLSGAAAPYRIGFVRQAGPHGIVVLATRLYLRSGCPGQDASHAPRAPADLSVDLAGAGVPEDALATDLLTGATPAPPLRWSQWLASRPLAVLAFDTRETP